MAPDAECNDLSANEKKLYELIQAGKVDEVIEILNEKDVRIDCLDKHGMTPLQQAAYKGNKELCQLMLSHGADINSNRHEHGYTALMFAALSGSEATTRVLLESGARTTATNSVRRTAAQMAGFVGQHRVVALINNFYPRDELAYYTRARGLDAEPKLPPPLLGRVHELVTAANVHPVSVVRRLQRGGDLMLGELARVERVLRLVAEREYRSTTERNDVVSLKMHFLAEICKGCLDWMREAGGGGGAGGGAADAARPEALDSYLRTLLRGRDVDGFPVYLEKFVRQAIRSYPYPDSVLLQQLVRAVAPVTVGDHPTALTSLAATLSGQRNADDDTGECDTCGSDGAAKRCSACRCVCYCDVACQRLHWFTHKRVCKTLAAQRRMVEARRERETREREEGEREEARLKEEDEAFEQQCEDDEAAYVTDEEEEAAARKPPVGGVIETREDGSELVQCPFTGAAYWMKDGKVFNPDDGKEMQPNPADVAVTCPFSGMTQTEGKAGENADPSQVQLEVKEE
ncbi:PREDICTED: ankyrin repeat and MYND domain-containing protein 2-like [Priapulus caudatus]|uniref:Ankyrin repeat and MYND domain-containing protein 2-like n=1 Tax=Priapulus caudatus TaxID=37621 RepID=A0ABM1ER67_PRICU|nr:PREDICTED: ankyrin repeat and MYND domain-containing protein 2-like [Priapulus caudatus]